MGEASRWLAVVAIALAAAGPALAQIRPETSGNLGHREPEMREHGGGLTHPDAPRRARRRPAR